MPRKRLLLIDSIKNDKENFIITKNYNTEYLIRGSYHLYERIIKPMQDHYQEQYIFNDKFLNLILLLLNQEPVVLVKKQELLWLKDWMDFICNTIIEIDSANLKDENMLKYIKLVEYYVTQVKKLTLEKKTKKVKNEIN